MTHAPVGRPPERYGDLRPGWHRTLARVLTGVLALVALGWLVWVGVGAADRDVRWSDVGFRLEAGADDPQDAIEVTFDVTVYEGTTATCTVRALSATTPWWARSTSPSRSTPTSAPSAAPPPSACPSPPSAEGWSPARCRERAEEVTARRHLVTLDASERRPGSHPWDTDEHAGTTRRLAWSPPVVTAPARVHPAQERP